MVSVMTLGTAQDGGFPHVGCACVRCERARREPDFARLVASLGVVDEVHDRRILLDASPDLPAQWMALRRPGRPALDEVWLTHGHVGHYAGLLHLGKETLNVRGLTLRASASMTALLRDNAPWSALLEGGGLVPDELRPDVAFHPTPDLTVVPISVPHRAEFTDTLGFEIRGPDKALFYAPDTDGFAPWSDRLEAIAKRVDVMLIDGSFWSRDELPGRDLSKIPHPFVSEELAFLGELAKHCEVVLTHFNHSNPLLDPASSARRELAEVGVRAAADGNTWSL